MAKIKYQNPVSVDSELDSSLVGTDSGVDVRREIINVGDPTTQANIQAVSAASGARIELNAQPTTQQTTVAAINFSASGDNTIIAASGSTTIRIWKLMLVVAGTTSLTIKDSAPTSFSGAMPFTQGGSLVLDFDSEPWYLTAAGKAFVINSSNAVQVSGTVWFSQS